MSDGPNLQAQNTESQREWKLQFILIVMKRSIRLNSQFETDNWKHGLVLVYPVGTWTITNSLSFIVLKMTTIRHYGYNSILWEKTVIIFLRHIKVFLPENDQNHSYGSLTCNRESGTPAIGTACPAGLVYESISLVGGQAPSCRNTPVKFVQGRHFAHYELMNCKKTIWNSLF